MKLFFRFIIGQILSIKAKQYLRKHRTQVIGITGSIGKTSTKEAIYQILKKHFNIYSSKKSFNTNLGLSLAVLQEEESGFSSFKAWFSILNRVLFNKKTIYQKMVLEMGADHRGDIKKLVKIAKPKIGVITNIAPVHLNEGQFNDINDIAREKENLVKRLPKDGIAVLNYDDPLIRQMETHAQKITFGVDSPAMVRAHGIKMTSKNISFTVTYKNESEEFVIPVLGKFQVYVFLPAIAVALIMGMKLKECADVLSKFSLPAGRMNPILGVNKSMIIDGSYNASPVTMKRALELMDELKADRKIAALGTMNELGEISKEAHIELGKDAAKISDMIIAVGPEAVTIKQGAVDGGMSEDKIFTFLDSEEAGYFLKDQLQPKDLILVKGSQNHVRMERFVKVLMANPDEASELLCRQGEVWEKI